MTFNKNILVENPLVATYNNVLSDKECKHFIDISKKIFKKSVSKF